MKTCFYCQKPNIQNIGSHYATCNDYRKHCETVRKFIDENVNELVSKYLNDEYSVCELTEYVGDLTNTLINPKSVQRIPFVYNYITEIFKDKNIHRGNAAGKRKTERAIATMKERYGVVNWGQTKERREAMTQRNKSPRFKEKISHINWIKGKTPHPSKKVEYNEYRKQVDIITNRNKKLLSQDRCYYTGMKFSNSSNPNCDRRKSIDHKVSIVYGFNNNIPAEEIGSINNICWCLKYVNSFKQHLTEQQFKEMGILDRLKESLNEN